MLSHVIVPSGIVSNDSSNWHGVRQSNYDRLPGLKRGKMVPLPDRCAERHEKNLSRNNRQPVFIAESAFEFFTEIFRLGFVSGQSECARAAARHQNARGAVF